jgi:hypothetical protein
VLQGDAEAVDLRTGGEGGDVLAEPDALDGQVAEGEVEEVLLSGVSVTGWAPHLRASLRALYMVMVAWM